jgi:lipopolysaccharide heptosyltransferase I
VTDLASLSASFRQVLIVKPSSLGDILHAFPLVTALRAARPDLSIDWVANGEYVGLVRRHPDIRNVWAFPRREFGRPDFFGKLGTLRKNLAGIRYDVVLDAQGLLRSALIARMALLGQPGGSVVGFGNAREGASLFYSRTVPVPETLATPIHAVRRNLLFLLALGLETPDPPETVLRYGPEDVGVLDALLGSLDLSSGKPYMVIHPGAKRESKKWPSSYYSELIRKMIARGYPTPVLLGDRGEAALLSEIQIRSGFPVPVLAGRLPLDLLPLFLRRASFFVGNDSGPLHMAALSGVPTLSFYGSSDPGRTGPWGPFSRNRVLREAIPCSPCGDFVKSCSHMTCQVSLTPERALEEISRLLEDERIVP